MILGREALGPEGRAPYMGLVPYMDLVPYMGLVPLYGIGTLIKGVSVEKQMATHSSILAWKISRTEETGWLQSMGSQSHTTENVLTQK